MTHKTKLKVADSQKFEKQIDGLKKLWLERCGDDLRHLDDIPNFTGMDESIPFPYGDKRGEDFGQWVVRPGETK